MSKVAVIKSDREYLNCSQSIKECFDLLGYDSINPLGHMISPGMTVVIKPNFVCSQHKDNKGIFSIITHPEVIKTICDYCLIALQGKGKVIIADAPQYDCNFDKLLIGTCLENIDSKYEGMVKLFDLRKYWSKWKHFTSLLQPLSGDPIGDMVVNLKKESALYNIKSDNLYGAVYHRGELSSHHTGEIQEYELSKSVMNADVVISIPKMKVHKKVGTTLNCKGLVGICTNKNYLVHYTLKSPSEGGDQYPDGLFNPMELFLIKLERWMYDHFLAGKNKFWEYVHRSIYRIHELTTHKLGIKVNKEKRNLDAGNWYGNDSAWRMVVDIMRIFTFSDKNGILQTTKQRKTFSIIDGIVGGENNGPLTPDPIFSKVIIAGEDFLSTDLVATRLMGFDPLKLKMYNHMLNSGLYEVSSLSDIEILSNVQEYEGAFQSNNLFLNYKPHVGWIGHIEKG